MTKKVFITGYYGFGNMGDEAILISMVTHLRHQCPDLQITATSATPEKTAAAVGVEAVLWSDIYALMEAVRETDLVIIGGGGIFHDYLGINPDQFLTGDHWGIPFYVAPAAIAILFDKPVMLYAVGVGPLFSSDARRFTKFACDIATAITVRDDASRQILKSIGVQPERIVITADPVFGFAAKEDRAYREAGPPRIAIALRQWSFGIDPHFWEQKTAAALDLFLGRNLGEVLFVPFQQLKTSPEDDELVAQRVQALMKHRGRTRLLETYSSPQQLLTILSKCDLIVGMRLHSMIFGMIGDVPLLALSYDSKVDQAMDRVGLRDFTLQISALDQGLLACKIEEALAAKRIARIEGLAELSRENACIAVETLHRGRKKYALNQELLSFFALGIQAQVRESHNLRESNRTTVAEQKHVLADRDKGIAFLRDEVSAREKIIAERNEAVKFLEDAILGLRKETESRDQVILERRNAMGFLQREVAAQRESLTFLRSEVAQREDVILEQQAGIERIQEGLAAQRDGLAFLRDEVAQRDRLISERQSAIQSLREEVAAQSKSVAFLRSEVTQHDRVIEERQHAIEFLQREVAAQRESLTFLRDELAQRDDVISQQQNAIEFLQQELAAREVGEGTQHERDSVVDEGQGRLDEPPN